MQKPTFVRPSTFLYGVAATLAAGAMLLSLAHAQQTPAPSGQKGSASSAQPTPAANPKETPSSAQHAKSTAAQKYRAVTEEDALSCSFSQDLSLSLGSPTSGSASASANHFTCLDKANKEVEIELISSNPNVNVVPKGGKIGIRTKRFGTIYRGNEAGALHTYEMTDSQIKQLKAFLGLPKTPAPPAHRKEDVTTETRAPLTLNTPKDKQSYAIGINVGKGLSQNLKQTGLEIEPAILTRAIKDVLAGDKQSMTDQEAQETLKTLQADLRKRQEELRKEQEAKMQQLGEANKKEGDEFLASNKAKEGVSTLPDGLQYKILQEGTGPKPAATDAVTVNYRGTLVNGTEFDSSYKRGQPATFNVTGIIKGWTEALELMPVGSKWQLFIPSDLAYGPSGRPPVIGPNSTLVFEVELISIQPRPAPPTPAAPSTTPAPATAPAANAPAPNSAPIPNAPTPAPKPTPPVPKSDPAPTPNPAPKPPTP